MRIGINGAEARVGQAYARLDTKVTDTNYTAGSRPAAASVGTVIALEKGPDSDMFFLSFDQIGDAHARAHRARRAAAGAAEPTSPEASQLGVRVFNEINASLAAITGVSMNDAGVKSTYLLVEQQLPSIPTVESFVAANQVGVAQMAIQYCDSLVESATAGSFFPGLNFAAAPATAFANTSALINPLIAAGIGTGLATQPDDVDVRAEINSLVDEALELRRQLCDFGAHQDNCQGGLRRRARQRHAPDQVTATPRPTRPTMKIRRKQALGPKEPLRHPDHPRPVTRREFLGQGFITGGVALAGVSAFSLFADPRKAYATLSPDIAQLKLPVSQGGLVRHQAGRGHDSVHML